MRMKMATLAITLLIMLLAGGIISAQSNAKYGGVDNCKMCHPDVFKDWSKSAHARSVELLVNVGQEKNADCLPCHTTGYAKGGYVDQETTANLRGVTCEACHAPSGDHMGDKAKTVRQPPAGTCEACHQKQNIHSLKQK